MVEVVANPCVAVKTRSETDKCFNRLDNACFSDANHHFAIQIHYELGCYIPLLAEANKRALEKLSRLELADTALRRKPEPTRPR
jgi:hypothetical protein